MAEQTATRREHDRRIVHCLLCHKPQEILTTHLARVCMKKNTPKERLQELQKAKDSMKEWTRRGRNWDYHEMCKQFPDRATRLALVRHLENRGFFISNTPTEEAMVVDREQQTDTVSFVAAPSTVGPPDSHGSNAEDTSNSDDASHDPAWQNPTSANCSGVRLNMQQMGLYEKFPSDTPILLQFKGYLIDHLKVPNCQQEIDNVSRMLRYMQPCGDAINMDFLYKCKETKDYIVALNKAKLLPATILNYFKNMIRFVNFLITRQIHDQEFRRRCESYIMLLNTLRKPVAKAQSKAVCKTRYNRFIMGQRSLAECQKLLSEAKKDMLTISGNLQKNKLVSSEDKTLFRYYCEAILVLGHFQRPGAVEAMSVTEWLNKSHVKGRVCVGVGHHTTATMQFVALTPEESAMLETYHLYVRPGNVQKRVDDEGKFFISHTGRPVHNASNDLSRLHAHYNLPNVTSQETRRVVETEASATCSEEQRGQVAHYLDHSTPVVRHFPTKTPEAAAATAIMLSSLTGYSSDEPVSGRGQKRGRDIDEEDAEQKDFAEFVTVFPVSLTGQPPSKKQRVDTGFPVDRCFYDKWRAAQFVKREKYLLSKCCRRSPTIEKVGKMIKKQGWTANHPCPEDVVAKWRPPMRCDVETDQRMMKRIRKQNWSGLALQDFGEKGQGVVATKAFAKGSIICDYHGKLITAEEGRKILEDTTDEKGYLFFFSSCSQQLCINAQTHPCECHPSMETVGRKLNHSRKKPNVKPSLCIMKFPEGEQETILLVAAKDIEVNEELRFNYGANRKSFRGEGLDLDWLNQ